MRTRLNAIFVLFLFGILVDIVLLLQGPRPKSPSIESSRGLLIPSPLIPLESKVDVRPLSLPPSTSASTTPPPTTPLTLPPPPPPTEIVKAKYSIRLKPLLTIPQLVKASGSWVCLQFATALSHNALRFTVANQTDDPAIPEELDCAFQMEYSVAGDTFTFRSRYGTYLATELDGTVSVDRLWHRSFEAWKVQRESPTEEGGYILVSAQQRYLSMDDKSHFRAKCVEALKPNRARITISMLVNDDDTNYDVQSFAAKRATSVPRSNVIIVTTMKPKKKWEEEYEAIQIRSLRTWKALSEYVHVVVVADDEETIQFVQSHGVETHADVEINSMFRTPTYRALFQLGVELSKKRGKNEIVMMSNSDILYDDSLPRTVGSIVQFIAENIDHKTNGKEFLIVGRRANVEAEELAVGFVPGVSLHKLYQPSTLFQDTAQDYFIISNNVFNFTHQIPPMVVGGIAFDNFLVSLGITTRGVHVFDATATLRAVHQNHGSKRFESHADPRSEFNARLAHNAGGWAKGKTSLAPFITVEMYNKNENDNSEIEVHERHIVRCDRSPEVCYVHHANQDLNPPKADDAFARPFQYQRHEQ